MVTTAADALGASGAGVLVAAGEHSRGHAGAGGAPGHGSAVRTPALELLATTSHAAGGLEMFQDQVAEGPCLDVLATGEPLCVVGEDIAHRWPGYGPALLDAGVRAAWAMPLRWRQSVYGVLNLFCAEERTLGAEEAAALRSSLMWRAW